MFKKVLTAILAWHLFAPMQLHAEQLLDEIVAVVDDDVITRSELDRATQSIAKQIEAGGNQLPPKSVLESQVLERMIIQQVQVARAEQIGIRVSDAEVDAALNNIARQNGLSLADMKAAIEKDGFSFADFRQDMKRDLQTERVRYAYSNSQVKVSDHEIDLFLADNQLDQGEAELQHILIAVDTDSNTESVQKAKQKAEQIRQQIVDGENFSVLASQFSDGQKALDGGRLGWRPINQLPPVFAEQVKTMSVGEVSQPIRSASGFHLLKVLDKRSQTEKKVEQYHAAHIMVATNAVVRPKQGMEIINNLYDKLQQGEDFAKLAEQNSDDHSSAPLGGDMGWFQPAQYGGRIAEVLKGLKTNEVSQPFQTEAGWHIMKMLGKREADITDEYKRQQAEQAIKKRKSQEVIEAWIRELRGEAFVDIRLE